MHIIVVGANGFIGSHFVPMALAAGHQVTLVGHAPIPAQHTPASSDFIDRTNTLPGGLTELASEFDLLASADAVCHFASYSIPSTSNSDPIGDIEKNLVATVGLLEAMRLADCKRMVFLSSGGAIYGRPVALPITENHSTKPISSYGVTKLAIESYLQMYADQYGFRPVILRPANAYGPGQFKRRQFGAVTTFLESCLGNDDVKIWGDGSVVRDYIYVTDICELVLAALAQDKPGIYNCGSGVGTDLISLIDLVETIVGKPLQRTFSPARSFDPDAIVLDISRAKQSFDWRPKTPLETGLHLTLAALLQKPTGNFSDQEITKQ